MFPFHNQKMLNEGDIKYKLFRRRFVAVQDSFEFSVKAYTDALPSHLFHIRFVLRNLPLPWLILKVISEHLMICDFWGFLTRIWSSKHMKDRLGHDQTIKLTKFPTWTVFLWIALISERFEPLIPDWSQMEGILK